MPIAWHQQGAKVMATTNNLKTFEPFADMVRANPLLDLTGLFDLPRTRFAYPAMRAEPDIRMDVTEDAAAYRVRAQIPGVKKEDIHVAVEGNTVSISAEIERHEETRKDETLLCSELFRGKAARSFTVMADVDESKAEAKYENGILELMLPKKVGAGTRKLDIK
jgi:HSP20 family protein